MLQCSIFVRISSINLGRHQVNETTQKARTDRPAQAMKEFAQQGVDYSKNLAEKSEAMADATGKSMQQTYSAAANEMANFHVQWIEMVRENTNASLDLARRLVTAKSPTEFFEASATHTRKQMETFAQQATMLLVMMIASKGIAGVPRASLVVVAATAPMFGLPPAGILLIMGIDQILDMGRTMTNVLGNGLATAAVAKWQGEIDETPEEEELVAQAA